MTLEDAPNDNPGGSLSWVETYEGNTQQFHADRVHIFDLTEKKSLQISGQLGHPSALGYHSFFFIIPYKDLDIVIDDKFSNATPGFSYSYSRSRCLAGSTVIVSKYNPKDEVNVHVNWKEQSVRVEFTCSVTLPDESSERKIKGTFNLTSQTTDHSHAPSQTWNGIFKWKEGGEDRIADEASVRYVENYQNPGQHAWFIQARTGIYPAMYFWRFYIEASDPTAPILNKTYTQADPSSKFIYVRPPNNESSGNYTITLTLIPEPFQCNAVFDVSIVNITEMTDGTFDVLGAQ